MFTPTNLLDDESDEGAEPENLTQEEIDEYRLDRDLLGF